MSDSMFGADLPIEWLVPLFAVIAFVYGSVGMGGGSSYLAAMALLGVDFRLMPPVALGLNTIVAGGAAWHYYRAGFFDRKKFIPLIVTSVPLAFLASQIPIERETFHGVLGLLLLIASVLMLRPRGSEGGQPQEPASQVRRTPMLLLMGAGLGLVAGLTGIGGGVYLVPILLALNLTTPKGAAALSAPFIVINSISGLAGRGSSLAEIPWPSFLVLAAVVLVAGQVGSRVGARRYSMATVRRVFGAIIGIVALNLLVRATF